MRIDLARRYGRGSQDFRPVGAISRRGRPTTGDPAKDTYVFEKDAILPPEGGATTIGKIDVFKAGTSILEAKQGSDPTSKKLGTAKRGTPGWHVAMNGAYGQAIGYARTFDKAVPFLVGCDIGHCFDLYAAFDGSWSYRPFPDATRSRIFLRISTTRSYRSVERMLRPPSAGDARHGERPPGPRPQTASAPRARSQRCTCRLDEPIRRKFNPHSAIDPTKCERRDQAPAEIGGRRIRVRPATPRTYARRRNYLQKTTRPPTQNGLLANGSF